MNKDHGKIELLAPAGGLGTALAAFDAGADAVYAGLNKFNARERTENFSFDDMSRLTAYARKNGRKVYVTFNTLIKESELPEVVEYLSQLSELRPDAVIVQDLGVLRIIREFFPTLRVHGSTQMGIHNSAGVEFAAAAGIRRVILERQVTLQELQTMSRRSPVELEVFVHGALCCSQSGTCLFSSWLGGWSGNRGKCKQPCRRWYTAARASGYLFSPSDLCMIEKIPLFKKLGIASLKIEGRLKKADYVRSVVSAYRMVIDAKNPDAELFKEAFRILNNTAGRQWTEGFSSVPGFRALIQSQTPGVWGFPVGRLKECRNDGIIIATDRRFHIGDRLRFLPPKAEDGPVMTVTAIRIKGAEAFKAGRGDICFIPCDPAEIPFPATVYKIGESARSNENRAAALPLSKVAVDLDIAVDAAGITLTLTNVRNMPSRHFPLPLTPAQKHSLSREKVAEEFSASCSETFAAGAVEVKVSGDWFVPASVLKQCRREFWDWVGASIAPSDLEDANSDVLYRFYDSYREMVPANVSEPSVTAAIAAGGTQPGFKADHLAVPVYQIIPAADEVVLPPFCPEDTINKLREAIRIAYSRGIRRFRITGVYGLPLLSDFKDLTIIAAFPLPVSNSMAAAELQAVGVNAVQGWLELEREELQELIAKSPLPVEIYRRGRPVLLATRAEIPAEGTIRDQRNNQFIIKKESDGITRLYPREVMNIPAMDNATNFYDLTNLEIDGNTPESTFNFNASWF